MLLLPLLDIKTDRRWRAKVEGWRGKWDKTLAKRAMAKADPINPQRPSTNFPRLPDHAIVTSDSGSCANWYARWTSWCVPRHAVFVVRGPGEHGRATYAIAAKFASPAAWRGRAGR